MNIETDAALRGRRAQWVCSVIYQKWSLLRLIIASQFYSNVIYHTASEWWRVSRTEIFLNNCLVATAWLMRLSTFFMPYQDGKNPEYQ